MPAPQAPAPTTFDLTLEEFCQRLSMSDSRVELIAGFYSDERLNQHFKASVATFTERYEAFQVRPA